MTWVNTPLAIFFFAILVGEAGTAAGTATTKARLEVRAAPACTTRADLAARVDARSPRIQFVDDAALTVKAVFTTPRPGKVVGEVVLSLRGSKRSSRRVLARSCADAADAVALIIAVTLDPTSVDDGHTTVNAERAPESGANSAAQASTAPSSSPPATKGSAAKREVQAAASPKTEAPVAVEPEADLSNESPVATRSRFGAHVAGQMVFGPAPGVMPGLALYAVVGLDRDAIWSPALIVGATYVWRDGLVEPGGIASFTLYAASLDVCPFRVSVVDIEARACASALVGRLAVAGFDTNAPASSDRPFATAGAAGVFTFGLGAVVEVSARLGMGASLVRDSFEFGSTIFYQTNRLTTFASLGIGARLP